MAERTAVIEEINAAEELVDALFDANFGFKTGGARSDSLQS